ncbi:hypothetical protein [Acinetobacter variabilis]|uniref:hypothetical protein n=1 Tax=Acinetobacter variabilis TaxID=70346 RepID=UPI0028ADD499|nr:hypothetical protein [Acinetobacter variabilis]
MSESFFTTQEGNSFVVRRGGIVVGNIVYSAVADEYSVYVETSGTTEQVTYGARYIGYTYTFIQARMLLIANLKDNA